MFKKLNVTHVVIALGVLLTVAILIAAIITTSGGIKNQAECEAHGGKWSSKITGYVVVKNIMTPVYESHCELTK